MENVAGGLWLVKEKGFRDSVARLLLFHWSLVTGHYSLPRSGHGPSSSAARCR